MTSRNLEVHFPESHAMSMDQTVTSKSRTREVHEIGEDGYTHFELYRDPVDKEVKKQSLYR